MQWLASLIFTAFLFVWTFFYAIFYVLAASLSPWRTRYALAQFWAVVILKALKLLCRLDYKVEGWENLPAGNHIFLMKHSSAWETIAQMAFFPPLVWVMKREIMWIPFVGWGCKLAKCIAIDRKAGASAVNQVLAQGKARLDMGAWIMIFPEGTRMPAGETRKYGVSGALLASKTGVKIVPVAHDAGYFWPRRGLLKKSGMITVRIGPPIEAAGRDVRQINDETQQWMEAEVARIRTSAESRPDSVK
jgi:1-acyl-sn-glycerol-3-phosphate acyltransferase